MSTLKRTGGTVLIVIDLQVGIVAACAGRDGVLARTNALIGRARAAGVPVFFVQHEEPGMEFGSDGWQLHKPLEVGADDVRVAKRRLDSFADTILEAELARRGADRLVIAGASTDHCVRTTIHRAAAEGYDVVLVSDCHTTEDMEYEGQRVTGVQIIANTNLVMTRLGYPGQTIRTVRAEELW